MNNKLSFKSRIEFVSGHEYGKRIQNAFEVCKKSDWIIENAKLGKDLCTKDVYVCNAGSIRNGTDSFMYHLIPGENINNFYTVVERFKKLKQEFGENLSGLIIGGESSYQRSNILFEKLFELYKKSDINFSYIFGKLKHNALDHLHYSTKSDTYSIYYTGDKITEADELKDVYSKIQISSQDELFMHGQAVDRKKHPELFNLSR